LSCANYEYDPYGNILSVDTYSNDNIGNINPIRYKDYYYDAETGWYQLSSRFYDPEVGQYLNADSKIGGTSIVAGLASIGPVGGWLLVLQ